MSRWYELGLPLGLRVRGGKSRSHKIRVARRLRWWHDHWDRWEEFVNENRGLVPSGFADQSREDFDGKPAGKERVKRLIREAASREMLMRVPLLTQIADGQMVYRKRKIDSNGRATMEEYEVTPRDRLYALELLGKASGAFEKEEEGSEVIADPAAIATALTAALRDPSVREWLMGNEQVMGLLRGAEVQPGVKSDPV